MTKELTGNDVKVIVGYGEVERDICKTIINTAIDKLPSNYKVEDIHIDSSEQRVFVIGTPLK